VRFDEEDSMTSDKQDESTSEWLGVERRPLLKALGTTVG
jgi:hypothetical protein